MVEERGMKLKLKFIGFPEVEKKVGGKEIDLDLDGSTYGDLLNYLRKTYGESIKKTLRQQIFRNGKEWMRRDDLAIHPPSFCPQDRCSLTREDGLSTPRKALYFRPALLST
jgi:hypothetical protein